MASTQIRVPLAFDRAVDKFRRSLVTDDEKKNFSHLTSVDDIWNLVEALQNEQGSRDSLQNMNRIQPFIDGMIQYTKVIEVFIQIKPEIMALIWGPLKLLLQLASNFSEIFEKILDAFGRIGESLPRLQRFSEIFSCSSQIQEVISMVYEDILEFYRRALKFFRRRAWNIVFSLTWTTFESRFGLILSNLQRHKDLVDREAQAEDIIQSHKAREEDLKRFKEHKKYEINRRMKEVMDWLKPINTEEDKDKAESLKRPGTGKWLLETPGVKNWVSGKGKQAIWLTGKPGSGKTILAYTVLEYLELRNNPGPSSNLVLYFFCSYREAASNTCLAILRTLVYQIISKKKDLLAYVYEELTKQLSISLLKQLFYDLIEASVSPSEHVYIIIDGLDELLDSEQKVILPILKALRSQKILGTASRILVASRVLETIRVGFNKPKVMEISMEGKNKDDILQYIRFESQRVVEELGLGPQMRELISNSLSARADGMFLWVHLIIESLLLQDTLNEVHKTLENLPEGLNKAYERILDRIKTLDTRQQAKARKILEWMACASRTLKIGELEDAISINIGKSTIDEGDRLLRDRLRYICGPIVGFSNGTITFVHFTAKEYLLKSCNGPPFIDRLTAHLNISLVCITYQCFNCFESTLSSDDAVRFVLNGDLRLFNYVQSSWLEHIKKFCKLCPNQSQIEQLSQAIRELFRRRSSTVISLEVLSGENGSGSSQNPSRMIDFGCFEPGLSPGLIRIQEYDESLAQKVSSLDCDGVAKWCIENSPLTVSHGGQRLQHVLEQILNEQPLDTEKIERLETLYGTNLYMCIYQFCRMSSGESFKTHAERKIHEDTSHAKFYRCQVQGCFYGNRNFTSTGSLKKHIKDYHSVTIDISSATTVEIQADSRKEVGQDPLIDQEDFLVEVQNYLENTYCPTDPSTHKIDWTLNSTNPQLPLDFETERSTIMETAREIINSYIRTYSEPTEGSYLENTESERIEIVLRQLSSRLKLWKDLVQGFYVVSRDLPATEQLILNILHCREQYSDDFETPNRRYTMTASMLERTKERLTKCFVYIENATHYTQDISKQGSSQLRPTVSHINEAIIEVPTEHMPQPVSLTPQQQKDRNRIITDLVNSVAQKVGPRMLTNINNKPTQDVRDLSVRWNMPPAQAFLQQQALVLYRQKMQQERNQVAQRSPKGQVTRQMSANTITRRPLKIGSSSVVSHSILGSLQSSRVSSDVSVNRTRRNPVGSISNMIKNTLESLKEFPAESIQVLAEAAAAAAAANRAAEPAARAQNKPPTKIIQNLQVQKQEPDTALAQARRFLITNNINLSSLRPQQLQTFKAQDLNAQLELVRIYKEVDRANIRPRVDSDGSVGREWDQAHKVFKIRNYLRNSEIDPDGLTSQQFQAFRSQGIKTRKNLIDLYHQVNPGIQSIEERWGEAQKGLRAWEHLQTNGIDPGGLDPQQFQAFKNQDLNTWRNLVTFYHLATFGIQSTKERWEEAKKELKAQNFLQSNWIDPGDLTSQQLQIFRDQDSNTWQNLVTLYYKNDPGTLSVKERWEQVQRELKARDFLQRNEIDPDSLTFKQLQAFRDQGLASWQDSVDLYHQANPNIQSIKERWEQAQELRAQKYLRSFKINPESLTLQQFQDFRNLDLNTWRNLIHLYLRPNSRIHSIKERWDGAQKELKARNFLLNSRINPDDLAPQQFQTFQDQDPKVWLESVSLYQKIDPSSQSVEERWEQAQKELKARAFLQRNGIDPENLTPQQLQVFSGKDMNTQLDLVSLYKETDPFGKTPTERWEEAQDELEEINSSELARQLPQVSEPMELTAQDWSTDFERGLVEIQKKEKRQAQKHANPGPAEKIIQGVLNRNTNTVDEWMQISQSLVYSSGSPSISGESIQITQPVIYHGIPEGPLNLIDERMQDAPNSNDSEENSLDWDPISNPSNPQPAGLNREGGWVGFNTASKGLPGGDNEWFPSAAVHSAALTNVARQGLGQGWQGNLTPNERVSNILEIISSLEEGQTPTQQYDLDVAIAQERVTYDQAKDKSDYQDQFRKKLLRIRESKPRQMAEQDGSVKGKASISLLMDIFEPDTLRSTGHSNQPSLLDRFKPNDNDGIDDHMDISEPENFLKKSRSEDTISKTQQ